MTPTEIPTPNESAHGREERGVCVRLLADDLTGACDAGAAFVAAGQRVRVWLGEKALYAAAEPVQAFNTASRELAADDAAAAVGRAAAAIGMAPGTIFFKKIDSAGRGPIGAEICAAQKALGARAVLLAPGFPDAGRTVRGGVLEVQDAAGQHSRVTLSELFPVAMRDGMAAIARADEICAAVEDGKTLLVCDSATQEELDALARAAGPIERLLYAGSAGLARAIARVHAREAEPMALPAAARTLVIAGTPHAVTRLQLGELESAGHLSGCARILRIACDEDDPVRIRDAFSGFDPEALILTGGDTALFAGQALGAQSIRLQGEFAAGIPWGIVEGGEADGRVVVTKSGGFGSATALVDLIARVSGAA